METMHRLDQAASLDTADETIEKRLRECLLELHDPAVLGKLQSEVSGLKMRDEQALERLRAIIRRAAAFDSDNIRKPLRSPPLVWLTKAQRRRI